MTISITNAEDNIAYNDPSDPFGITPWASLTITDSDPNELLSFQINANWENFGLSFGDPNLSVIALSASELMSYPTDTFVGTATQITQFLDSATFTPPPLGSVPTRADPPGSQPIYGIDGTDTTLTLGINGQSGDSATNVTNIHETFTDAPSAFNIDDVTTGAQWQSDGTPYTGTAADINTQLTIVTPDNLLIGSMADGVFIYAGTGNDNIYLGDNAGKNVLEGSQGDDLLTGGSGDNTYMVDDINTNASTTLWTTINNFHAGDSLVVWGLQASDFALKWSVNGNPGYTGLTLEASAPGKPDAYVTIAGYSQRDLNNGRLATSFGGQGSSNPYMLIVGHNVVGHP